MFPDAEVQADCWGKRFGKMYCTHDLKVSDVAFLTIRS